MFDSRQLGCVICSNHIDYNLMILIFKGDVLINFDSPCPHCDDPLPLCVGTSLMDAPLGTVGHCSSRFKRAVSISCRPCVDVHKGRGLAHVDRGGQKPDFFVDVLNGWPLSMDVILCKCRILP